MAAPQKFCLKWNNFQNSVTSVFENLRQDEELVDITLCCEGQKIKAHRMMLSACSPFFRDLLKENPCQHPVFFLKDTSYPDLAAVVEFVYKGEVNVLQSQLGSFLKTAEMLQVKGLSGDEDDDGPGRPQPTAVGSLPADRPGELRARHNSSQPAASSPLRSKAREPPDYRPVSPRTKRRRLSGGDGRLGSPSPLPPVSAAPPPPPLPAVPTAMIDLESPAAAAPVSTAAAALEPPLDSRSALHQPAPPPPPPPAPHHHGDDSYNIKVEKVDITDGDDDASLETALGHVSNMEASQLEGSDHSTSSHDMAGLLSRLSEQGGSADMSMVGTAGTSEDGSSQGPAASAPRFSWLPPWFSTVPAAAATSSSTDSAQRIRCPTCSRDFTQASYSQHVAMHRGRTTCHVCQAVYATRFGLRRHLAQRHPERSAERAEGSHPAPRAPEHSAERAEGAPGS